MSTNVALQDLDFELVLEDGAPVESWYHRLQMVLFIEVTRRRMLELRKRDFFLNGNMFLYYSLDQARAVAEAAELENARLRARLAELEGHRGGQS